MSSQEYAIISVELKNTAPGTPATCQVEYDMQGKRTHESFPIEAFEKGLVQFALCAIDKPRIVKTDGLTSIVVFREKLEKAKFWQNDNRFSDIVSNL